MIKEVFEYNKNRVNRSGLGPRDRQLRQQHTGSSNIDDSVLLLKEEILNLKEQMLNLKTGSVKPNSNYTGKLYTEEEFNDELSKAIQKEIDVGAVNKSVAINKELEEKLAKSNFTIEKFKGVISDLENRVETAYSDYRIKENELMSVKAQVDGLNNLIEAKNETIASLNNKPIIVKTSGGANGSEPEYDVPSIEVETIDPSDKNTKLESFITINEITDHSEENMSGDMDKLKSILGGGIK